MNEMKKKLTAWICLICLVFTGCAGQDGPDTTTQPPLDSQPVQSSEPAGTDTTTQPTEPAPTDPVVQYTHPLTGAALDAPLTTRLFVVSIDNDNAQASPHWGVSQADILYEVIHEGGSTRMLGVYDDLDDVPKIGPTRSARVHLLSVAMGYNAVLVHAGYSPYAKDALENTGWNNVDGVSGAYADRYFHRDQDRLSAGRDSWHTMYTTGPEVLSYCEDAGYSLDSQPLDYGYLFAPDATPAEGVAGEHIQVRFKAGCKKTDLYFDQATGRYTMEQFGQTYVDANNGQTVSFQNVLALEADVAIRDDYGRLNVDITGAGKGYFACGGKMVEIRWERESENVPFSYYLSDGTPLTLGQGNSYVAVYWAGSGSVTAQ